MDRLSGLSVAQSLVIALIVLGCVTTSQGNTLANSWIYFARDAKNVLRLCPTNVNIDCPAYF